MFRYKVKRNLLIVYVYSSFLHCVLGVDDDDPLESSMVDCSIALSGQINN